MNISEIYRAAERAAAMSRKARRLYRGKLLRKYPELNPYDFADIVELYVTAGRKS